MKRIDSLVSSIQSLLTEAVSQLKRHPSLPGLVQPIFFFISEVMEQVNDNHPAKETYQAAIPELLKIVNTLVTNRQTQVLALDTLYDVIIQGDCLRGQWKPIISCLKVRCTLLLIITHRKSPPRISAQKVSSAFLTPHS